MRVSCVKCDLASSLVKIRTICIIAQPAVETNAVLSKFLAVW